MEFLAAYDVVVDATADSTATALLTAAANAGAGDCYRSRARRRVRRAGRPNTTTERTDAPAGAVLLRPRTRFPAGCGSPISTTPPGAVWEAAAMAARHTIGLLTAPDVVPAGEERVLSFGGEPS